MGPTSTKHLAATSIVLLLVVYSLVAILVVYADGEDREEEKEKEEFLEELAEVSGSIAFYLGLTLNLLFVVYSWVYPLLVKLGANPFISFKKALVGHAVSNIVLGVLALFHSLYFLEKAGLVEYIAGALILLLLVTGSIITIARRGRARRLAVMLHLQRLFSIILIVVVVVHIAYH